MAAVDRLPPDASPIVVCLGGGPSLCQVDVDRCRGRATVIAIKDAVRLAPWADVLYACDAKWWRHHGPSLTFEGPRYSLEKNARTWAQVLTITGEDGLEMAPTGLRTGKNSGYQAINVAVHLGARRIVLLGYDLQADASGRHHWFGLHPWKTTPPYALFLPYFVTLIQPLQALGIEIVNCSRVTALTCFPRQPLEEALP